MKFSLEFGTRRIPVDIVPTSKSYRATLGDDTVEVEILRAEEGRLELLVAGQRVMAYVSSDGAKRWVTVNGQTFVLTTSSGALPGRHGHRHAAGELTAPMPGVVRSVNVIEGEPVVKGQTLMVPEAMKMEIRIQSPKDGVVTSIMARQGQTVEREQKLLEIVDRLES